MSEITDQARLYRSMMKAQAPLYTQDDKETPSTIIPDYITQLYIYNDVRILLDTYINTTQ